MKNLSYFLLGFILLVSCQNQKPNEASSDEISHQETLTQRLTGIHKQGHINGFGVALVNENEVLYSRGFGFADVEKNKAYTDKTIQNIGSVSKTFIGLALMKAQELGALQLDDPINQYLPFEVFNPTHPKEKITIRHLATHTSTILDTDYYNEKSYVLKDNVVVEDSIKALSENFNPPSSMEPLNSFLEKLLSVNGEWYDKEGFLKNKPGQIYEYSNVASALAALVIEQATGQSYEDFTTEHILKPIGMNASGFSFENIDLAQHSTLYARPKTTLPFYSLITYPDGGLKTNASDMAKYLSELIKGYSGSGKALSTESYDELFSAQLTSENIPDQDTEDDYDDEYNTGIFMGFTPKGFIGHTGGDPGIACFMFFKPQTKTGKLLMINTSVRGSEGVKEFYDIWYTLDEYESKLNSKL